MAISICIEAAELLEHFQWENSAAAEKWKELDQKVREDIESEMADVVVYLAELANLLNVDLAAAFEKKLRHIERKYPAEQIRKHGDKFYYQQKKRYRLGRAGEK